MQLHQSLSLPKLPFKEVGPYRWCNVKFVSVCKMIAKEIF